MSFYSDQADAFLQMADEVQTRLDNEGAGLDEDVREQLEDKRDALQDAAGKVTAADIKGTLEGLAVDRDRLAAGTTDLQNAVKNLAHLDQVLGIVAAAVTLAVAIASANPGAIVTALEGAEKVLPKKVIEMVSPDVAKDAGLALAAAEDVEGDKD